MKRSFKSFFTSEQITAYQRGTMNYRYRDRVCNKSPIDLALYLRLLQDTRPRTLFEIGSKAGGSTADACTAALDFFADRLHPGEWLAMEDGVLDELGLKEKFGGAPNQAIAQFLEAHPGVFEIGVEYCDMFGPNATYNPNGYLKRTAVPFSGLGA